MRYMTQLAIALTLILSAAHASADYLPSSASAEQRVGALERTRAYLQSDAFVASRLELRRFSDDAPRDLVELALHLTLTAGAQAVVDAAHCLVDLLHADGTFFQRLEDAGTQLVFIEGLALTALLDQLSSRDGLYPQVIVSYLEHQGEDGAARVVALLDDESATVREAAVIALPHPKWSERPLACVVLREGESATKDDIITFLDGRVAKWWLPDDVAFVDEIPKTSVGKFSKKDLRERFEDYTLPTAAE